MVSVVLQNGAEIGGVTTRLQGLARGLWRRVLVGKGIGEVGEIAVFASDDGTIAIFAIFFLIAGAEEEGKVGFTAQ
jgi:hypothetical protein